MDVFCLFVFFSFCRSLEILSVRVETKWYKEAEKEDSAKY